MASEQFKIKKGQHILVPAVNGRRQKRRADYGEVIDSVKKQSGETVVLVLQGKGKLAFTMTELQRCWDKNSDHLPRVRQDSSPGQRQ